MPNQQKIVCYYGDSGDLYEIILGGANAIVIIKYRHGLDCLGEEVDFDVLSYHIQQGICKVIRHALDNHANSST